MGTRSLTHIRETEKSKDLLCIYRQMDGYCAGHGKDLKTLLTGYKVVNGLSGGDEDCVKCGVNLYWHKAHKVRHKFQPKKVANGMGDLAAQVLVNLKTSVGDIYVTDPNSKGQSYEYILFFDGDYFDGSFGEPDVILMLKVLRLGKVVYSGTLSDFNPMFEREKEA